SSLQCLPMRAPLSVSLSRLGPPVAPAPPLFPSTTLFRSENSRFHTSLLSLLAWFDDVIRHDVICALVAVRHVVDPNGWSIYEPDAGKEDRCCISYGNASWHW